MAELGPAIRMVGLCKRYRGVPVLQNLSVDIPAGAITALVGHNGAGKSTLMHAALGLVRPDRGFCEIFGEPADMPSARIGVGFLPEEPSYEPGLRVGSILALHRRLVGRREADSDRDLLDRVGLTLRRERVARRCSRGEARRLALACALAGRPRLLVLDEPTSGMDPANRRRFLRWLAAFREGGGSVLISSHVLSELETISDRFVVLDRGRLVSTRRLERWEAPGSLERSLGRGAHR